VCCGTKRLVQIQCPTDCTWLASAREHPPAVAVRQQQRDVAFLVHALRDFDQRQTQIFFLVSTFLLEYPAPDLQPLIDHDVAEAVTALAATYETAARGVIYEHRPPSLPAERLMVALKPVLADAGKGGGSAFERDVGFVLRRVEEAVRDARGIDAANRRTFLDLLSRVVRTDVRDGGERAETPAGSGLIVP
jgi:hypothetical protein